MNVVQTPNNFKFHVGDFVKRSKGSWYGIIVGGYSTHLTPIGYNVMSLKEIGCVHVEPEHTLEPWIMSEDESVKIHKLLDELGYKFKVDKS